MRSADCSNNPGPWITFSGLVAFGDVNVDLIFRNNVKGTHEAVVESTSHVSLSFDDQITIPKQPGAVLVIGQVYNSNALTYTPGRNAGWYLSNAGGSTKLADKGAIFIVRADGSVSSGKQGGFWSGSVLSTAMGPGDTIVVPERPVLGSNTLKNVLSVAQIAFTPPRVNCARCFCTTAIAFTGEAMARSLGR